MSPVLRGELHWISFERPAPGALVHPWVVRDDGTVVHRELGIAVTPTDHPCIQKRDPRALADALNRAYDQSPDAPAGPPPNRS